MESVGIDACNSAQVFRGEWPLGKKIGDPQPGGEMDELGGPKPIYQLIRSITRRSVHDGYCAESCAI